MGAILEGIPSLFSSSNGYVFSKLANKKLFLQVLLLMHLLWRGWIINIANSVSIWNTLQLVFIEKPFGNSVYIVELRDKVDDSLNA
jgi:hypothetical protein